jgi:hypothetical protein
MRSSSFIRGLSIAGILAGVLVACDNAPPAPSTTPNPGGTQPPSTGVIVRVDMTGPNSIAPGATAQFTLRATYSDGSTQDKSSEATWRTSNTAVIAMSPGGIAVGRDRGEASITASFSGRSTTRSGVLVLPDGTFRVRGAVRDAGVGVTGARVEVTEGPSTGLMTTSNGGSYSLYGVAGDVEITVTKDGFQPIEQRFQVTANQTQNFDLALSRPRDMLEGTYQLRATAAEECRQNLPGAAQERSYTATIVQDGPRLTVTLGGATFFKPSANTPTLNIFRGINDPGGVLFTLNAGYYYSLFYSYWPDIAEQIGPNELLSLTGSASLSRNATGLVGTLNGEFVTTTTAMARRAFCRSTAHRFELIGPEK